MEKQGKSLPVFNPEQINEQITYLAGIQDPQVQDATPGARTISELRRVSAENEAILDRVRVRLARQEAAGEARKEEHRVIGLFQSSRKKEDPMQEHTNSREMSSSRNRSQTNKRRFPR